MKTKIATLFKAVVILISTVHAAQAVIVIQHIGANDPLSEGWNGTESGDVGAGGQPIPAGAYSEPVVNDMGTGIDAWRVGDDGSGPTPGETPFFSYGLTEDQANAAANSGWKFTIELRVVNAGENSGGDVVDHAMSAYYAPLPNPIADGRFWLRFGSGDAGVDQLFEVPSLLETQSIPGGGYHRYELVGDPANKSASLFIDGSETPIAASLVPTDGEVAPPHGRIYWGDLHTVPTGDAHYSLVRFEVGPFEPISCDLNGSGACDATDLRTLLDSFFVIDPIPGLGQGNLNGDGTVDERDYLEWESLFLAQGGNLADLSLQIPEPASLALLIPSVALMLMPDRRRNVWK